MNCRRECIDHSTVTIHMLKSNQYIAGILHIIMVQLLHLNIQCLSLIHRLPPLCGIPQIPCLCFNKPSSCEISYNDLCVDVCRLRHCDVKSLSACVMLPCRACHSIQNETYTRLTTSVARRTEKASHAGSLDRLKVPSCAHSWTR